MSSSRMIWGRRRVVDAPPQFLEHAPGYEPLNDPTRQRLILDAMERVENLITGTALLGIKPAPIAEVITEKAGVEVTLTLDETDMRVVRWAMKRLRTQLKEERVWFK